MPSLAPPECHNLSAAKARYQVAPPRVFPRFLGCLARGWHFSAMLVEILKTVLSALRSTFESRAALLAENVVLRDPRRACSQGVRFLLPWPPPSRPSYAAAARRALVGARATCSTQGRHFSTCPRWAPSRVLRSGRLRLTIEAQLVEGAARDSCVRADAPCVRTPDPGVIHPKVALSCPPRDHPSCPFRSTRSLIGIIAADNSRALFPAHRIGLGRNGQSISCLCSINVSHRSPESGTLRCIPSHPTARR